MKVKVLGIKETGKSFNIAHVQLGNLFGDCLAVQEITQPGEYELRSTILVENGRLVPKIRVEQS